MDTVDIVEIIDGYLPKEDLQNIQTSMEDGSFPWYWNKTITYDYSDNERGQFTHPFWHADYGKGEYFHLVKPLVDKLFYPDKGVIYRIKANLNPRDSNNVQLGDYHVDFGIPCKTAIFYVNTNNGFTRIKGADDNISCVENRMVIFDSHLPHVGFSCTDKQTRMLINFNYVTHPW